MVIIKELLLLKNGDYYGRALLGFSTIPMIIVKCFVGINQNVCF